MRDLSPGALLAPSVVGPIRQSHTRWKSKVIPCPVYPPLKVEQQNKLAEKQAMLFKHSITTLLPMLESGQFSDYKLQCGDEIIDVHKVVLKLIISNI